MISCYVHMAPFSSFYFHKLLMQFQMERGKSLRQKATPTSAAAVERPDPGSCLWEGLHNSVIAPSLGSSRSARAPKRSSPVCGWEGGQTACRMAEGNPECQILVVLLLTTPQHHLDRALCSPTNSFSAHGDSHTFLCKTSARNHSVSREQE